MSEPAGRIRIPARIPPNRKSRRGRRVGSSAFTSGSVDGGRKGIPATPLRRWKFNEAEPRGGELPPKPAGRNLRKHSNAGGETQPDTSARRLAAGIWNLWLPEVSGGGQTSQGLESNYGQLHVPHFSYGNCMNLYHDANEKFSSLLAIKNKRNGISHKLEAPASLPHPSIERATKWDPGYPKVLTDAYDWFGNTKLLKDQETNEISVVSALRSELELAQTKVSELEDERQLAKEKLNRLMRNIEDEKAAWRRREHEKIRSVIDAMKEDLNRERKNRKRLEIMNNKLVNELTEAKLSAKKLSQEYEKERKARELVEEVCNELANEIGDEKAEVEALKVESMKTREEVEEERKMLQMAEVWREERVQMKLIDAKLTLEEKYSQLSMLQCEIEAFLRSRCGNNTDIAEMKHAEALKKAVGSVKAHDIKGFSYQPPPASEDIFSIFEELQPRERDNVKEIGQYYGSVTPEANELSDKRMKRYDNLMFDGNGDGEDGSGWETMSHMEEQDSSKSLDGSEPSVNGVYVESHASVSGTDWDEHGDDEKQNSEISEVCSITTRQSRKKGSSISRLWKSSRANNAEDFKKISFELTNEGLCNGRSFNATLSPSRKSGETILRSPSAGSWSVPDLLNPNATQGMKGHVEWPQGPKKQSLKAKLMEARIHSQKVQLRQVLKQKI